MRTTPCGGTGIESPVPLEAEMFQRPRAGKTLLLAALAGELAAQ